MKQTAKILAVLTVLATLAFSGTAFAAEFKVATNAEFEPFEFIKDGQYAGFDIELLNEICKKTGDTYKIHNMEFDGVVGSVVSKTCDLAVAGLTITPKRAETIAFSISYLDAAQYVIVNRKGNINGKTKAELDKQLEGKKIGVVSGYIGEKYVTGDKSLLFPEIKGAKVFVFDNVTLAVADLKNGRIDAVIMDDIVSKQIASKPANKSLIKTIEVPLTVEQYAIGLNKKDTATKAKIDKALAELIEDGTVAKLLKKWGIR